MVNGIFYVDNVKKAVVLAHLDINQKKLLYVSDIFIMIVWNIYYSSIKNSTNSFRMVYSGKANNNVSLNHAQKTVELEHEVDEKMAITLYIGQLRQNYTFLHQNVYL